MARTELSYCGELVRRHDNDRFLCALFAPAYLREDLFALYAFNLEVARIGEAVSEPGLGAIRLQWWREAVDGIYAGTPQRHPVVGALAAAVSRHDLTRYYFDRLLDAHLRDVEGTVPATMADLEDYAAATSSGLVSLSLEILSAADADSDQTGRAVGIAYGLAGLLRAQAFRASTGRIDLPEDLMAEHGLPPESVLAGEDSPALRRVAGAVADKAARHLASARAARPKSSRAMSALLPEALTDLYLRRLARRGYDLFDPRIHPTPLARHLRLLRAVVASRHPRLGGRG